MSHKETIQKIVSDQSGGLSDLQAGLEHRIQQLANLCDGQGRQVEQNTAQLAAILADVNRDFDGVRQELANFKVNIPFHIGSILCGGVSTLLAKVRELFTHTGANLL